MGGDKIRFNEHTNIGVAVAVEDGLLFQLFVLRMENHYLIFLQK